MKVLFNLCFPDCCKVLSVILVCYSCCSRYEPKNYCPVSLFSVVSKVFEKLINNKLARQLKTVGLCFDFQFGLRSWLWMGNHLLSLLLMLMLKYLWIFDLILRDTVEWGCRWLVSFNAGKTELFFFYLATNSGVITIKIGEALLEEKSPFQLLSLLFTSKLDWGSYIFSFAKADSKKIGALLCSMKFLSLELVLYHYKSLIRQCMENCCHVWDGAGKCYFNLLDKLKGV